MARVDYNTSTNGSTISPQKYVANELGVQTFTASKTYTASSIKLKAKRYNTPGTVTVSIRATDGGGDPTGGDLTSGTYNGDSISTSSYEEFETTITPYSLTSGTKYAIVVAFSDTNATERLEFLASNSNPYANGVAVIYSAGSWTQYASFDVWFEVHEVPPPVINTVTLGSAGSFIVCTTDDGLYTSSNFGSSWSQDKPDGSDDVEWSDCECSSDGSYMIAVRTSDGAIYRTANGGSSWGTITPAGGDTFTYVAMDASDDGVYWLMVGTNATDSSRTAFLSEDYGATWTAINPTIFGGNYNWTECQISNTGLLIGLARSGAIYMSWNGGDTWEGQSLPTSGSTWEDFAISGDGKVGIIANTAADNEWFKNSGWYLKPQLAETTITEEARTILESEAAATDSNFMVGDGTDWVAESGDTARTSLGLGTGDSPTFTGLTLSGLTATRLVVSDGSKALGSATLASLVAGTASQISVTDDGDNTITLALTGNMDEIAALTPTDGNIIVGNGSTWIVESGDTARTSLGLGTGNSPEFAGLTITTGGSLTMGGLLRNRRSTTTTAAEAIEGRLTIDTTSGDVGYGYALSGNVRITGGNNITSNATAAIGQAQHGGTGTVALLRGFTGQVLNVAAGTTTVGTAVYAQAPYISAGAVTTANGVYIEAQNQAAVTNAYGIYQAGTSDLNYFGGFVGFNETTPLTDLHVSQNGALGLLIAGTTDDTTLATHAPSGPRGVRVCYTWTPGAGQSSGVYDCEIDTAGSNNMDHLVAYQDRITHSGSGTIDTVYGVLSNSKLDGGTVTNKKCFAAENDRGTGTITNQYGVYIANLTRGATNYGIYQAGATPSNYFAGVTSIDNTFNARNIYPMTDDTYYLGKNDDDTPYAWKGIILKDQAGTGKYYRLEVSGDALQIVDLTD